VLTARLPEKLPNELPHEIQPTGPQPAAAARRPRTPGTAVPVRCHATAVAGSCQPAAAAVPCPATAAAGALAAPAQEKLPNEVLIPPPTGRAHSWRAAPRHRSARTLP
jgi:hypothetical protein